jgi:hypothetical protein
MYSSSERQEQSLLRIARFPPPAQNYSLVLMNSDEQGVFAHPERMFYLEYWC